MININNNKKKAKQMIYNYLVIVYLTDYLLDSFVCNQIKNKNLLKFIIK